MNFCYLISQLVAEVAGAELIWSTHRVRVIYEVLQLFYGTINIIVTICTVAFQPKTVRIFAEGALTRLSKRP